MLRQRFKFLFVLLTAVTSLGLSAASPDSSLQAASLVARYEFEDAGNLGLDTSGFFNQGTPAGGVSPTGGIIGAQAAFFDGSSGKITVPPLNGYTGLPGFTFAAWVNLDAATGGFDGVISQDSGGCCEHRLLLHPDHRPYINVHQHLDRHIGPPAVPVGAWTHVVMTGENVGGGADGRVYINGAEVANSPQAFALMPTSAPFTTYLATGEAGTAHLLRGALDDVRVYDGALTPTEVNLLFQGLLDPPTGGPAVPEPSTLGLAALGALAAVMTIRRRKPRRT